MVSGTNALLAGNNRGMAVRYSVHADSREECAAAVDELCARLGAVPAMKPVRLTIADGRWLARAIAAVSREPAEQH